MGGEGGVVMAVTPESLPENTIIDFRAPPPSPIASGRRSSVRNENVLSEFLEYSLKVPDLVLPDRVFPRQKSIKINPPPQLDLTTFLESSESNQKLVIDSIAKIGCFEVFNHGIPTDLIKSVLVAAGNGIFGVSPEIRKLVTRCYLERPFGFEEIHGEDGHETPVEFVWSPGDDTLNANMKGISPIEYSNFSEKMEKLLPRIQDVGKKILAILLQQDSLKNKTEFHRNRNLETGDHPICYFHKHSRVVVVAVPENEDHDSPAVNSLRYDVIRMLIRGSEFPHALCLHLCNGAEEFQVYSKKGWVSFHPNAETLVITVGDKLQAGSGGKYKHVMGKPIFKGNDNDKDNPISMAFLYSPPEIKSPVAGAGKQNGNRISIRQQIMIGIVFILLYQLILCFQSL